MRFRIGKALAYAVLLWVTGFIWGSIVFMTPALKNVSAIPYVSRNPAISFPILIFWSVLVYLLARNFLKATHEKSSQGLKLGLSLRVPSTKLHEISLRSLVSLV